MTTRRQFLQGVTTLAAASALPGELRAQSRPVPAWNGGDLVHLLATVNDERMLIKASFVRALAKPPRLLVDKRAASARRTDSSGEHWEFTIDGLQPARRYTLHLVDAGGKRLADPWPLKTFPSADARSESLRVLMYTCPGGHDVLKRFLPMPLRIRLFERALSFEPDVLIANGDQVYWDLRSRIATTRSGRAPAALAYAGDFDRTIPVLGTPNESVLKRAVGPQIAPLYGTRCRSIPVFFMRDDHDYFDNDEADDRLVTFPPDAFMFRAARATQFLYYPEFLPEANRPLGLPGASASDRVAGASESFGTLRYGKLAEFLMYDCRGYITLAGKSAGFVPPDVENWLKRRMAAEDTDHLINVPSTPIGWSAGKWGEWYADVERNARLTTEVTKPYWQSGWRAQHDRLAKAGSEMKGRTPFFISGDLHAIGEGIMRRTNDFDLSGNPVVSILTGPLGTGDEGWPSAFRGMRPQIPAGLEFEELYPATERHGFILLDMTPDRVTVRFFEWDYRKQPPETIDALQPFRTSEWKRPTARA